MRSHLRGEGWGRLAQRPFWSLITLSHARIGSKGDTDSLPGRTAGFRPVLTGLVVIFSSVREGRRPASQPVRTGQGGGYPHRESVSKEGEDGQEGSRHTLEMLLPVALAVCGFSAQGPLSSVLLVVPGQVYRSLSPRKGCGLSSMISLHFHQALWELEPGIRDGSTLPALSLGLGCD